MCFVGKGVFRRYGTLIPRTVWYTLSGSCVGSEENRLVQLQSACRGATGGTLRAPTAVQCIVCADVRKIDVAAPFIVNSNAVAVLVLKRLNPTSTWTEAFGPKHEALNRKLRTLSLEPQTLTPNP